MIKKSLIQGLYLWILSYSTIIFFGIFEIKIISDFVFTLQGTFLFYLFWSVVILMYMRI